LDQVGLSLALSDALKRKVDIVSERGLNKHLCQRILQEAVPLWVKSLYPHCSKHRTSHLLCPVIDGLSASAHRTGRSQSLRAW